MSRWRKYWARGVVLVVGGWELEAVGVLVVVLVMRKLLVGRQARAEEAFEDLEPGYIGPC